MNIFTRVIDRVTGRREIARQDRLIKRYHAALSGQIDAGSKGRASPGWNGIGSHGDEDAANKEYLRALPDVLQRSQDLDVNNPDLRGFHRTRTAQIVGAHVRFKSMPRSDEVGLDATALRKITSQIDRIRKLHSDNGGFDSTGHNRSEGEQQVRAILTAMIHGSCLIHRVWRPENPLLPVSLELIPGVRISTPNSMAGSPLVSYGIEYSDANRTRVVAFHVRRVSQTRGDSFVPEMTWDRLPLEDCSYLQLPESAGMDRSMPLSVACIRMLRNRGEMMESAVSSARAQAKIYASEEVEKGANAWDRAVDDADQRNENSNGLPTNFQNLGDVQKIVLPNGSKMNWCAAKLPDPDFTGFMGVTDVRMARGLTSSKSRFTREVTSSWAGGRMEDQQDDPIIDQYRNCFVSAWRKVHQWVLQSIWLTNAVDMPGYSAATAIYWSEFRAEFPGKLHINPVDTMAAREKGYQLRTTTPQQACEEDGKDLDGNIEQWAQALKLIEEKEKEHGLKPGSLSFLLSGKTISTTAGDEVGAPIPIEETSSGQANLRLAGAR